MCDWPSPLTHTLTRGSVAENLLCNLCEAELDFFFGLMVEHDIILRHPCSAAGYIMTNTLIDSER